MAAQCVHWNGKTENRTYTTSLGFLFEDGRLSMVLDVALVEYRLNVEMLSVSWMLMVDTFGVELFGVETLKVESEVPK